MHFSNPFSWFRPKPETFTACAASAGSFQTSATPSLPLHRPASPSDFQAAVAPLQPQDFGGKVVSSYRYRVAAPTARAAMLRTAADSMAAPVASVAPLRSGPAKVAPVKSAPSASDWTKLNAEADSLLALAGKALIRVRQEKQRAEISALSGLDKTRAAFRAQIAELEPTPTMDVPAIVKRSKPSQNPAFIPEPSQDVRLRECNKYYADLLAEIEIEYQAAIKAGRISQELLARRRRIDIEWKNANDKILGRDIRK
jgi:hypothetical protein